MLFLTFIFLDICLILHKDEGLLVGLGRKKGGTLPNFFPNVLCFYFQQTISLFKQLEKANEKDMPQHTRVSIPYTFISHP
jgi:hypothetical protein